MPSPGARRRWSPSTANTQVVRLDSALRLLTDLDQKLELLAQTGVDDTYVIRFDLERAAEPAEHFVQRMLVDCLNVVEVVVGEDFHFGHRRRGDVALLEEMGSRRASRCAATSSSAGRHRCP